MLNYYRRCISKAAHDQATLNECLKESKKNDKRPIVWSTETDQAFEKCRKTEATLLAHPQEEAPLVLATDASDTAVGAALEQVVDGNIQPLAFFSRKLSTAERKYSIYDRELLAIYKALRHLKDLVADV